MALKQRFIYYKNKLHNVPQGLSFLTPESFEKAQYPSELVNSVTSEKNVSIVMFRKVLKHLPRFLNLDRFITIRD